MLLYYRTFPPHSHTRAPICSQILTHFTMATIWFHVLCVSSERSETGGRSGHLSSLRDGRDFRRLPLFYLSAFFFPSLVCSFSPEGQRRTHPFSFAAPKTGILSNKSTLSVYRFIKACGCFYWFGSEAINKKFIDENNNITQPCGFSQQPPAGPNATLPRRQIHNSSKLLEQEIDLFFVQDKQNHAGTAQQPGQFLFFSLHPFFCHYSLPSSLSPCRPCLDLKSSLNVHVSTSWLQLLNTNYLMTWLLSVTGLTDMAHLCIVHVCWCIYVRRCVLQGPRPHLSHTCCSMETEAEE